VRTSNLTEIRYIVNYIKIQNMIPYIYTSIWQPLTTTTTTTTTIIIITIKHEHNKVRVDGEYHHPGTS
jgi:hypothetical protein